MKYYKKGFLGVIVECKDIDAEFISYKELSAQRSKMITQSAELESHYKEKFLNEFTFDVERLNDKKKALNEATDFLNRREIQFNAIEKSFYDMKYNANSKRSVSTNDIAESIKKYLDSID